MSQQRTAEASEAEIAVHWQEEANVNPPEKFVVQANLTDKTVLERFSLDNFPDCFKEYADLLDWYKTWDVTLDMPMVPELPITMLACARLGVIHSQVFSGFSGKATADRIVDAESPVLITMDAYYRGGQLLDHKQKADVAVNEAEKEGVKVEKVLVWQRYPGRYSSPTPLVVGRDFV